MGFGAGRDCLEGIITVNPTPFVCDGIYPLRAVYECASCNACFQLRDFVSACFGDVPSALRRIYPCLSGLNVCVGDFYQVKIFF